MTRIHLWRGFHGREFRELFARAYKDQELLVVCPPTGLDERVLEALPPGELVFHGEWHDAPRRLGQGRADYPAAPVLGVFTTGSTAAKKLVLYSRANIKAAQDAILELFDRRRIDTVYCYPQPYHVFGLLLGHDLAARRGLQLVAAPGPYGHEAHELWLSLQSERLLTLATPSHMRDLCAFLEMNPDAKPRRTYSCILGGAKVDKDVWLKARAIARIEEPSVGYGCTEASPGVTHLPPGVEPLVDGDLGWPLGSVTMAFDAEEPGYSIHGPGLCLALSEGGALTFPTSHQVRDELTTLSGGRYGFAGRLDFVLNRGGEKFPLERIEAVLKARHALDTICVALPDPRLGEELGILARAGRQLEPTAIYATLTEVFQRRFNPGLLTLIDELPLNANAKLDRHAAKALVALRSRP